LQQKHSNLIQAPLEKSASENRREFLIAAPVQPAQKRAVQKCAPIFFRKIKA
jgi:hypothetical protein